MSGFPKRERAAGEVPAGVRLQKYLSRAGVASRRAAERWILEGRVTVDGRTVRELGTRVVPGASRVEVDGRPVRIPPPLWVALHKPPGTVCSRSDPRGRPTVMELLPPGRMRGLFHVGRLDYLSEGLLLLTNEGDVAHRLLHPSRGVKRRYEVVLLGEPPEGFLERLAGGVRLEDGLARAEEARLWRDEKRRRVVLTVTLREGRNREIRRMMQRLGVRIRSLKRVAFGPVELGDLPPGAHRPLGEAEVEKLREAAGEGKEIPWT